MNNLEDIRFKMTKENTMKKLDSAIKDNKVDITLIPFLKKFNKKKNFFTSSSCCGRIMLLGCNKDEQKQPNLFMGKWHRTVKVKEVLDVLNKDLGHEEIWLKQEPFIFHFVAKNEYEANKILKLKTELGIKRGGIFFIESGRYIIEIIGSKNLNVIVKINDKILFDKKQLSTLIKKANYKLKNNYKVLKNFEKEFLKLK